MILPRGVQTWLACAEDTVKYSLVCPWFTGHEVAASDGKMIVITPVTEYESDVPGPIPVEAMKEAFKYSKKGLPYQLILKDDYVQTIDGKQFPRWGGSDNAQLKGQRFPETKSIVESADKLKRTVMLGIDAGQLMKAAKAGGNTGKTGRYFVFLNLNVGKDGKISNVVDVEVGDCEEPKSKVLVMPVSK